MSMKGLMSSADPDKIFKKPSRRRNDSDELDVFEAARYFSGYNEPAGDHNYTSYAHKYREEDLQRLRLGGRRISLDLPIRPSDSIHYLHGHDHHHVSEKHEVVTMSEKLGNVKHMQPSSPGGRIASFLNSLFHQARSKKSKSKSKSKSNAQARDEDESPGGWRRRRRSSISHFLMSSSKSSNTASTTTTTTSSSSKSLFSSSSSGFRTPPPYINTPTKNYKEFLNYSSGTNHVEMLSLDDNKKNKDLSRLDEKLKLIETLSERQRVWADERRIRDEDKFSRQIIMNNKNVDQDDDGAESDSSSDLFELQNYDLSCGGLPVYETTNVDTIKKSTTTAPVSTRPL